MRSNFQTPGLRVPAKTRIARREHAHLDPALRGYAQRPASDKARGETAREVDYAKRTHQSLKIEGFGGFAPPHLAQWRASRDRTEAGYDSDHS